MRRGGSRLPRGVLPAARPLPPPLLLAAAPAGGAAHRRQQQRRRQSIPAPGRLRQGANGVQVAQQHDGLRDTFGRFHDYLRISITERCNLRCQYCMPKDGVDLTADQKLLTTGEIIRLAKVFCTMGVRKIRLTGGEPLVRRDFDTLATGLGSLRADGLRSLCITTNGLRLSNKLPVLHKAGLDRVNISLDTLCDMKFEVITRRRGHHKVLKAIDDCLELGLTPKINCVVVRGVNDEEVADMVERFCRDLPIQVRFIEYMPFHGNGWQPGGMVPWMETWDKIEKRFGKLQPVKVKRGDTSKNYSLDGMQGSVGFITTMTDAFCGTCNRLRMTADGELMVCLHDVNERSLLRPLRDGASDEELMAVINDIVLGKKKALGGHDDPMAMVGSLSQKRAMIRIGG